jgi:hypothetical protein
VLLGSAIRHLISENNILLAVYNELNVLVFKALY